MSFLHSTLARTLPALLVAALGNAHAAPTIWRCAGNSYSGQPCSGGQQVDVASASSADEQRHARDVAERDRRLAREMVQERKEREGDLRQAMGSGLTGFANPAALDAANLKPASARPAGHPKKPATRQREKAPRLGKAPKERSPSPAAQARAAAPSAAGT